MLACGIIAALSWGFGFYGLSVYLTELRRLHGWPTSLISIAVTIYYLVGAGTIFAVGALMGRLGPRPVLAAGAVAMAAGVAALGVIDAPWQLFAVYLVLAGGWACLSSTGISETLLPWFERRRGLALTLALTGASVGGMLVVPVLVLAIDRHGFRAAMLGAAVVILATVLPLVVLVVRRTPAELGLFPDGAAVPADTAPGRPERPSRAWTRAQAMRTFAFWTLTLPFALALAAQVGLIVHQLAMLEPALGRLHAAFAVSVTTVAALVGRVAAGLLADRMNVRVLSAVIVAVQAAGVAALAAALGAGGRWPPGIYAGCVAFGLGVGNAITLPPLIVHAEFGARSYARIFSTVQAMTQIGVAAGPSVVGVIRDHGGDAAALWVLVALQAAAALGVLAGRRLTARSGRR